MNFRAAISRVNYKSWSFFVFIVLAVFFADVYTKHLVLTNLAPGDLREVIPNFFNIGLTFNKGAAFGFMADLADGPRHILLAITAVLALSVVLYFLAYDYYQDMTGQGALALIVGGALGNISDRFRHGMVVDFLDFYLQGWHWPAFNLADSAICVAVFLLLIHRVKTPPATP